MKRLLYCSLLCVLLCAGSVAHAAIVGHWVADDLTAGGAAAPWPSQVGSWDAVVSSGAPPVIGNAIGGRNAVQFGDAPIGALQVNNSVGPKNPLAGLTNWSATVVFQTSDAAGGGGGATNPSDWWLDAGIIGSELPTGEAGDWGLWMTDGNSTGGAKVGASRGDPDAGVFNPSVMNDGNVHVMTGTYELSGGNNNINLFVDGSHIGTTSVAAGGNHNALEDVALYFGTMTGGGKYKGLIGEIQLDDAALSMNDAIALQNGLLGAYTIPEPSTVLLSVLSLVGMSMIRRHTV